MRDAGRLAEVMRSVNPNVHGLIAQVMANAADHLDNEEAEPTCLLCGHNMATLALVHPSPHIRELAHQAALLLQGVTVQ